jgi:FkbM family methyltransferase
MKLPKLILNLLPIKLSNFMRIIYYHHLIKHDKFDAGEPEYNYVESIISPDDWVIDIGANMGTYTAKFSKLVGKNGRVIAFEPILETFRILASNATHFKYLNTSLINAAVSDNNGCVNMQIPLASSGQRLHWEAHIVDKDTPGLCFEILCLKLDSFDLPNQIKLIKIDAEGHETSILHGMMNLIKRDKPILIIEGNSLEIELLLKNFGYGYKHLPQSPNRIYSISVLN